MDKNELLHSLYTNVENNPSSFSGINVLHKAAKTIDKSISVNDVKNYLKSQKTYTLHRNTFKRFPRRKILAPYPKVIVSSDLVDMSKLSSHNSGYRYLLVVIDVFSRYAQVVPLKRKTATDTLSGLKQILESDEFQGARKFNSDEGKEYYNAPVKKYLSSKDITLYSTKSREIKAAIAERFIRTIKGKIYKYLTHNNTLSYIAKLPNIISNYNHSIHRILKNTPFNVHHTAKNSKYLNELFNQMYKNTTQTHNPFSSLLTVGEYVRIADEGRNKAFRRGYSIQNTWEIFRVKTVDISQFPATYTLEDQQGEDILGVFYREELIPTHLPQSFDIDIIRSKKVGNSIHHYVSWRGYPPQFNSWIKDSDIVHRQQ